VWKSGKERKVKIRTLKTQGCGTQVTSGRIGGCGGCGSDSQGIPGATERYGRNIQFFEGRVKVLLILVLILLLAAGGAAAWLWYGITQPYQGFSSDGVFVTVPHGASSRGVARLLQRNGVVRSAKAFELYARRHPKRTLQA